MRYPPPPRPQSPSTSRHPNAAPDMAKEKAKVEALRRHKPKRSPSGEYPAVEVEEK